MAGNKILLVDDSELVAGMLSHFLEEEGFQVVRAANGIQGIELAYKEIPDLIIMDVEMPVLQGYQASRLLKNRRAVRDIPIIMHTSLSEDKDKYWALSSGVDDFVSKDFDNLGFILEKVKKYIDHPPFDVKTIQEDALQVNHEFIFEMLGSVFDQQLFQSTILNLLGDIGRDIGSLGDTIEKVLGLIYKVCDAQLAVVILNYNQKGIAYAKPGVEVVQTDVDEFINVCLNDFYTYFQNLNLESVDKRYIAIEGRDDFGKIRIDNKKISSYSFWELKGKGGEVIGTLHLGHFSNNYFSRLISENVHTFAEGAGIVIENSLLFNQVTEMEKTIRQHFSKFVPIELINNLLAQDSADALRISEKRNIVVLFTDIRLFTSISENNSAEAVVRFLNEYFNIQVNIIQKYGGMIDKFIGDAVLAIFGAPVSYEDNVLRAMNSAVEIIGSLDQVDVSGLNLPDIGFEIGIGLHEGEAIVGNIGSMDKMDYTAIGDTVNLAARLEGLTKHYKQPILLSEDIKKKVEGRFYFREADVVAVKGKDRPTTVYTVDQNPGEVKKEFLENYTKGIKLYKMGNWDTALEYFKQAKAYWAEDHLTDIYIDRCEGFKKYPPKDWKGYLSLNFK